MKLGVCCSIDRWNLLRENGYDYAEFYFANITRAEESDFRKMQETRKAAEIDIEACNGFFPADFCLLGENKTPLDTIREYAEKGFYRIKTLGAEIAVVGSGKARNIPENMEKERAEEEFITLLNLLGDLAKKNDIRLTVEPLRYKETNFINTVADGYDISCRTGNDNIGTIADFFHFFCNNETLDIFPKIKDRLFHTHLARPNLDRKVPTEEDRETCQLWANSLREIGYNGRVTIEAIYGESFEEDIKNAYNVMKMFR